MAGGRLNDFSGLIITGGVSQLVVPTNTARQLLLIQNVSSANLWINFDSPAGAFQASFKIPPDAILEARIPWIPTGQVHIFGLTTGQIFVVKEG